ncbi:SLAM family member 6-like isoform X2 [Podarcis raffonei]|uniref:SLAM family member 6-like isoform X2 n=1 Tax=Podarcis raffonei TaxID=65483 RepID=UPI0023292E6E|nr:SLAM family member 6-like isoform X2 [Podarcis raffonei]
MIVEVASRSLLAILLFAPWICTSFGSLSHGMDNPIYQVNGIMGESVLFPVNVSSAVTVEKMEWDFYPQSGGLGYWLGEFSHGKLEHPSPTDRFGQRLDMVNETTLRIKDLELDDGGIYNARIWFTKAQFQEQSFSLMVYEPVPAPQIHHQVESKTPDGCNVTLRCHTPGREDLSISWETGDLHRALGKSVNQYQVSDNGRELRVSLWNSSLDSKFTCLVSNSVDQKRASFDLLKICQSDEGGHLQLLSWSPWLISSVIVLLVIMVMVMVNWMCWKIRLERNRRGVPSVMREKGENIWSSGATQKMVMMRLNTESYRPTLQVDSEKEEFSRSSTLPRKRFPSLTSCTVSETEPSEIEHCMRGQAHLQEPLLMNSLRVPQEKDPLQISQSCQLSRSYSLPSTLKHCPPKSRDQDREQHTKTYLVTTGGLSLRARSPRNAFITSTSQERLRHSSSASLLMETAQERLDE